MVNDILRSFLKFKKFLIIFIIFFFDYERKFTFYKKKLKLRHYYKKLLKY
jgi:hypothetical protein